MIDRHPTRAHLLRLVRQRGGATLDDLQRETGLSRSALRQHLTFLERDGLIRERLARGRVGRPPIVYEPAPAPQRNPAQSYAGVLRAILRVVGDQGEAQVRRVVEAAADEIARRHPDIAALPDLRARITAALAALMEDPRVAEVRSVGPDYEVVLHDCPFLELAREFNEVCEITRELLFQLTGAEVEQREWLVRGDPRCSFVVKHPASQRLPAGTASTVRTSGGNATPGNGRGTYG